MGNLFSRIWEVLKSPNYSRTLSILTILIVAAAVPLTVYIAQQQQEIRQRAAGTFAIGGKVVNDDNVGVSGVKILVYNIRNGGDVSKILTTGSNGTWVLDSPDVLETDSFGVWPQCVSGYTGMPYNPPSGLNCDPKALSSPNNTFPGTTQFPNKGGYYDSNPTNRLANLMAYDFKYTRTTTAGPSPTSSPTSGPTPTNVPFCSKAGEACRTSGTTDVCCSGLECDASSVGSATGTCRAITAGSKITVGGFVKGSDGVGIGNVKILVFNNRNNPIATTRSGDGYWETDDVLNTDSFGVWPQCVSALSTMLPYYSAPAGYVCSHTTGPKATSSPGNKNYPGTSDINSHTGDYYDGALATIPSGGLKTFNFEYQKTTTPPSGGCTDNAGCPDNQFCNSSGNCQTVTCPEIVSNGCSSQIISNHACQSQNSPDGTSCPNSGTCQNGSCVHAGQTTLALQLNLTGIGGAAGNPNPLHAQREVTLCLYGAGVISSGDNKCDNATYKISQQQITKDASGKFTNPSISAGNIITGPYNVFVKVGKYLRKQLPGIQNITSGTTIPLTEATLIVGDVNGDNQLNIADYNLLVSCYGDKADTASCNGNKDLADFNDDGKVDGVDYKLFIDSLSVQEGD